MKKINSLKRNEEIAAIVHNKKFIKNDVFVMYYQPNEFGYSRICISVSKKLGHAVVRNKTKRQVREMLSKLFDLSISKDYVIVIRSKYLENDFQTNNERLQQLYLKLNSNKE